MLELQRKHEQTLLIFSVVFANGWHTGLKTFKQ